MALGLVPGPIGISMYRSLQHPPGLPGARTERPGPIGMHVDFQSTELNRGFGQGRRQHSSHEYLSPQQRAEVLIDTFASTAPQGVFTHIVAGTLAASLRLRVYNPSLINQGVSSLCGPAVFMFDLATRDPVAYVQYVIQLYTYGTSHVGNLEVTAGTDLRAYNPQGIVDPADWIALASLRDSENFFFDYQSADNQVAGITLPGHLEKWFTKLGYQSVLNETNLIRDKDESNIRRANDLFTQGFRVCLFIHSKMLSVEGQTRGSLTPDHWVVLTSNVRIEQVNIDNRRVKMISLSVFTWGDGDYEIPALDAPPLALEHFLNNYYGFVAAKY